jgi:hypothetical protein
MLCYFQLDGYLFKRSCLESFCVSCLFSWENSPFCLSMTKGSKTDMQSLIKSNPKYKKAAKALKEGLILRKTAAFAEVSVNTVRKIKVELSEVN